MILSEVLKQLLLLSTYTFKKSVNCNDINYFCLCRLKMLLHSTISGQSIIVCILIRLKLNTQIVRVVFY